MRTPHELHRAKLLGNLNRPSKKRIIKQLLIAQHPHCFYCGDKLTDEANARLDHFYPVTSHPHLARDRSNLVLACIPCDNFKHAQDPTDIPLAQFKRLIAEGSAETRQEVEWSYTNSSNAT